ncbi:7576_t:CDS:1, partial [Dentiscutata erythropus]
VDCYKSSVNLIPSFTESNHTYFEMEASSIISEEAPIPRNIPDVLYLYTKNSAIRLNDINEIIFFFAYFLADNSEEILSASIFELTTNPQR